jgi:hypothetical protein
MPGPYIPISFETFVSEVVKEARRRSRKQSICRDNLRQFYKSETDYKIDKAVTYAIDNTMMWDGEFLL